MTEPHSARFTSILITLALVLPACDDAPGSGGVTVTDSAGVEIVTSGRPVWAVTGGWTVAAEPSLQIGTAAGRPEYELFRPLAATRLNDGRIVVGNIGSSELRFYASDGTYQQTVGGSGSGPGEIGQYSSMYFCTLEGGRLFVSDPTNTRINVYSASGDFLTSSRLEPPPVGTTPTPLGCFDDGTWLGSAAVNSALFVPEVGRLVQPTLGHYRYGLDGAFQAALFQAEGAPVIAYEPREGVIAFHPVPLIPGPLVAAGADLIYLAEGGRYEFRVYSLDGSLARLVRWGGAARTPTPDAWDRYTSALLEAAAPDRSREALRNLFQLDLPLPEYLPTAGAALNNTTFPPAILEDAGGRLWLARYWPPWDPTAVWDVFGPDGRWLGPITLPAGLDVIEIGLDYVLGRHTDELGIERIRLHELIN